MIKTLRRRVAIYTIIAVAAVLILLMGIINIANYIGMDRSSGETLSLLLENDGRFPMGDDFGGGPRPRDEQENNPWSGLYDDDFSEYPEGNFGGWVTGGPRRMNAETPFETRFFSVVIRDDGTVGSVDTGQVAAVSRETAQELATSTFSQGKSSGYRGRYKYDSKDVAAGKLYVFLDCSRDLESFGSFLRTSFLVSLLGLILIAGLVIALSPRMVKPIAESYEKQKQFISDAGHELKTPLAVIGSCAEVLEMESGENKWTAGIKDQVKRMGDLTHQLISLARMDEAENSLTMSQVDLTALAKEAQEPFILLSEQKNLRFNSRIEDGLSIKGNDHALRELINILLDNAIKYATGDEVTFTLGRIGKHISIETRNPAEGLTPGKQNRFFDRFYRGDSSRSSGENSGYGIGLSMAKSIVNLHGGTIEANSPDGKEIVITARL